MTTASPAGWRSAVTEIERAIGDCLAALDKYEAAFARAYHIEPPPADRPNAGPGGEADGWDGKLSAAGAAAAEAEQLLAEQERVWGRWRAALADWERLAGADPAASNATGDR